jgi:hypothetical protein
MTDPRNEQAVWQVLVTSGIWKDVTEDDARLYAIAGREVRTLYPRPADARVPEGEVQRMVDAMLAERARIGEGHEYGPEEYFARLARAALLAIPPAAKPEQGAPDEALLISMATCLNHGFGLLSAERQRAELHDMRKVWDEVQGRGYYSPERRDFYLSQLNAEDAPFTVDAQPKPAGEAVDAEDAARYRWLRTQYRGVEVHRNLFSSKQAFDGWVDARRLPGQEG